MYLAYKYSLTLDTSAFFLALTASGIIIVLSAMASEEGDSNDTNSLIREMLKQVSMLQEKVDSIQKKSVTPSEVGDSDDEMEGSSGSLVELSETTKAFLEAAFSATMPNEDRKKRVVKVGIPDCDQIRCPKLDGVLKAVLPKDAIKADGYLSRLQQFWLDAVPPLAALLESTEAGDLMPEKAVSATQTALYLMGNAHQQMAQERRKKLILKLNPSLKFMAEDNKSFASSAPMLFGKEFAKQATTTVDQVKAMKKLSFSEKKSFSGYHPRSYQSRGGGAKSCRARYQPYQRGGHQTGQSSNRQGQSSQEQRN